MGIDIPCPDGLDVSTDAIDIFVGESSAGSISLTWDSASCALGLDGSVTINPTSFICDIVQYFLTNVMEVKTVADAAGNSVDVWGPPAGFDGTSCGG